MVGGFFMTVKATNWSKGSTNPTDWTKTSITGTNWEDDNPSAGDLLLESSGSVLVQLGTTAFGLQ